MRILWIKTELLHPVDKGGKIRTYHMLKELRKFHHITYLTLDDGTGDPDAIEKANEYAHEVITIPHRVSPKFTARFYAELGTNLFSSLPYFVSKYRSRRMKREIERLMTLGSFDVVICDFLVSSVNLPDQVSCPLVLFQHNVEAMIWRRHFETAESRLKRAYLHDQWRRTVRFEKMTCRKFDAVVAVSPNDASLFANQYEIKNVYDVPTGVDLDYFTSPNGLGSQNPHLVFTGSMDWLPNHDAVMWFVDRVLPIIRKSFPDTALTVVGRDPFPSLLRQTKHDPLIRVTGRVTDIRPFMQEAGVYVVPIRIGGGTRLKLYEAMAMGLPIVSTSVGAEGLPLSDGKELVLRDTAEDFAEAVVKLLKDRTFAKLLGSRAGERARNEFGWPVVGDAFTQILIKVCSEANSQSCHVT
ncbi:MAG: glycosyltransferase [Pyrinomonadaceae bacterium]|nr:glycosyltransferase [Blastocatellia bacterium]MCW5957542.1 glycosyltransferase [Pyrinomonadaceae bacterium]